MTDSKLPHQCNWCDDPATTWVSLTGYCCDKVTCKASACKLSTFAKEGMIKKVNPPLKERKEDVKGIKAKARKGVRGSVRQDL